MKVTLMFSTTSPRPTHAHIPGLQAWREAQQHHPHIPLLQNPKVNPLPQIHHEIVGPVAQDLVSHCVLWAVRRAEQERLQPNPLTPHTSRMGGQGHLLRLTSPALARGSGSFTPQDLNPSQPPGWGCDHPLPSAQGGARSRLCVSDHRCHERKAARASSPRWQDSRSRVAENPKTGARATLGMLQITFSPNLSLPALRAQVHGVHVHPSVRGRLHAYVLSHPQRGNKTRN